MSVPYSILDLAPISAGQTVQESLANSVKLAQTAEEAGYKRVWYAEHHNMPTIASSATSVVIAHVANHTKTIRLGAGGIMLPNHSPLVIAEQFGTLASLHPDRIDLGLGRAPGTDQITLRALRRDAQASQYFPQDVVELQGYLGTPDPDAHIRAVPGANTHVPLYILGSSLFGAQLAAALGVPYAFASHFAPAMMHQALDTYRERFKPSEQLAEPYAIVGVNVFGAATAELAEQHFQLALRNRVRGMLSPAQRVDITHEQLDLLVASPQSTGAREMLHYRAVGTQSEVQTYLADFVQRTGADELIQVHQAASFDQRLESVKMTIA